MLLDGLLDDLLDYLRLSPTPFHAVENACHRLQGFTRLDQTAAWSPLAPGRYFVVHEDSALVAFVIPDTPSVRAFRMVVAHTDSPNLRLKPNASYAKEGYLQLGVEVYGGVLLNSWLDRDLGLAGRAVVRAADGALSSRLFCIHRPLARVAQLAIHLDRDVNDKGITLNRQQHLPPIVALAGKTEVGAIDELCAEVLGVAPSAIVAMDRMLFDIAAPCLGGLRNDFVFAARLDNLAMCHAATLALNNALPSEAVSLVALFDHEEVGSGSAMGAQSALLPRILERIVLARGGGREALHRALAGSTCISADMAHAVHPNYADRHDPQHRPVLNGGPVLKVHSQQRYATMASTAALFRQLCDAEEVPMQLYAHRSDLPCGSTIGPITATLLGIPTVDVGNPMLSMHSCREVAGSADAERMTRVLTRFLQC